MPFFFGYGGVPLTHGRGRHAHGARLGQVVFRPDPTPPGFFSPDGLEMPPPVVDRPDCTIDPMDWFFAATKFDAELTQIDMSTDDEGMKRCSFTVDVKDRYRHFPLVSVHAIGPPHADLEGAKKLGMKAVVTAMNAETQYWIVDFSYLKLRALEMGQQVTDYLRSFTHCTECPFL
ncbi:hypothetical protein ACP70R_003826 [Stipagrostis hirtigluma subsp. patula]